MQKGEFGPFDGRLCDSQHDFVSCLARQAGGACTPQLATGLQLAPLRGPLPRLTGA